MVYFCSLGDFLVSSQLIYKENKRYTQVFNERLRIGRRPSVTFVLLRVPFLDGTLQILNMNTIFCMIKLESSHGRVLILKLVVDS